MEEQSIYNYIDNALESQVVGPGIIVYKNAIPKELDLINRLESALSNSDSPFQWRGSRVGFFKSELDHRNCQDFIYTKEQLGEPTEYSKDLIKIHEEVEKSLRACMDDYTPRYHIGIKWFGAFNMVKYGPGEKFNVHSDDGDPYRCTVSCVAYINDNYTGGDLYFNHLDLKIKPEAGDLILFPSSYIYSHASIPVEEGVKYAIVIMTDRNEFAHRNDSPIYYSMEEQSKYGLS
jgi:hypothetical protein